MPEASGAQLSRITVGIVRLHRDFYGKGPIEAKSYAINDTIICLLRGGFTTVEETLLTAGEDAEVERVRRTFQVAMKDRFVGVIEDATERKVVSYMSQVSASERFTVEIFLLEPHEEPMVGEDVPRFDESGGPSE